MVIIVWITVDKLFIGISTNNIYKNFIVNNSLFIHNYSHFFHYNILVLIFSIVFHIKILHFPAPFDNFKNEELFEL